ncbi:MAG: ABC transporter ATP-binding protein, partial [Clostridia bacterium]|nr:ABC transporter ATP-binding protein [Clostridia bacterium]
SDMIVVMKAGEIQQIGKPQDVYDSPVNLFVAKFLGTPPINVFEGRVSGGRAMIGEDCVLEVPDLDDQDVYIAIRPEGFRIDENGPLHCDLVNVEVMGRDSSVISTNPACMAPAIRSIIGSDARPDTTQKEIRFSVLPHKIFIFAKDTEARLF